METLSALTTAAKEDTGQQGLSPTAVPGRCWQSDGADPGAEGWKREDHRATQQDPPLRTGCRDPPATTLLGKHPLSITTRSGQTYRLGEGRKAKNNKHYFLNRYIHPARCPVAAAL